MKAARWLMRKLLAIGVLFSLSVFPSVASATSIEVGDTVTLADGPGNTGGGEFLMTANGTFDFITFCLQRTEYIDFTHTFRVDGVSTYAETDPAANGGDAQGRDELSQQTAYLYTMFRNSTLFGYDYVTAAGRLASANNLQRAFWMFEQELPMDTSNPFVILANAAVLDTKIWSGLGNVRVLNLTYLNGTEAQDQLALVDPPLRLPPPPVVTPEPASLLLLATGLSAAAGLTRRRQRRHSGSK